MVPNHKFSFTSNRENFNFGIHYVECDIFYCGGMNCFFESENRVEPTNNIALGYIAKC